MDVSVKQTDNDNNHNDRGSNVFDPISLGIISALCFTTSYVFGEEPRYAPGVDEHGNVYDSNGYLCHVTDLPLNDPRRKNYRER